MSYREKGCFVTVGATAAFDDLVAAALSSELLSTLAGAGYTRLVIQFGKTGAPFFARCLSSARHSFEGDLPGDLEVEGFDFKVRDFQEVIKGIVCGENGGLLIAHAGTGSLMDGIALKVPTILVPNPSLADNHQAELAEQFEKAGYCVYGDVKNLSAAVLKADKMQQRSLRVPRASADIWTILDQEMGFTDRDLD